MQDSRGLYILSLLGSSITSLETTVPKDNDSACEGNKTEMPGASMVHDDLTMNISEWMINGANTKQHTIITGNDNSVEDQKDQLADEPQTIDEPTETDYLRDPSTFQEITTLTDVASGLKDALPLLYSSNIELGEYTVHGNGEVGWPHDREENIIDENAEVSLFDKEIDLNLNQDNDDEITRSFLDIEPNIESLQINATLEFHNDREVGQPEETADAVSDKNACLSAGMTEERVETEAVPCAEIPVVRENIIKKKRTRKRKADPDLWERNIRKRKRMCGESYTTKKGVVIPQKVHKSIENCGCRFKCANSVTVDQQEKLFKEYWSIGDSCRQKAFITKLVEEGSVMRHRKRIIPSLKEKSLSRTYYLPTCDNKEKARVCSKFFCSVFQISMQVVVKALKKSSSSGVYIENDGRKGRPAPNKTKQDVINHVKAHIDSFPRMESHYCRKDSKKLYLASDLNVSQLYRLYVSDYCTNKNILPVKEQTFRAVFKSYDPPLATYKPKKDQCSKCNQYRDALDKSALEADYQVHYRRKTEAMEMKKADIELKSESRVTATFDLQAVLAVPFAGDCQIYYKRKLSVYNFTVFDSNGNGYCYLWDETNGMKGSSEIGTGLTTYLKNLPPSVTHVTTYSDTCGGQNRNQFIAAALLHTVNTSQNINTIDMKFMESGHSYLEADSMHATIERARKHKKVYTTREWGVLIEMARRKPKPYNVTVFEYSDILDLKSLGKSVMINRVMNSNGATVNWLKIKWMRFTKNDSYTIQYKYELQDDLEFKRLVIIEDEGKVPPPFTWDSINIDRKYSSQIPISEAKKKDLVGLLKTGVIPNCYRDFVEGLPSSKNARDVVPYTFSDDPINSEDEKLLNGKKKNNAEKDPKNKEAVQKVGSEGRNFRNKRNASVTDLLKENGGRKLRKNKTTVEENPRKDENKRGKMRKKNYDEDYLPKEIKNRRRLGKNNKSFLEDK